MPPSASDHQASAQASSMRAIYVMQMLVGAVVALVSVGAVPFAMDVKTELSAIRQILHDKEADSVEIKALRAELTDLRIKMAGQKP